MTFSMGDAYPPQVTFGISPYDDADTPSSQHVTHYATTKKNSRKADSSKLLLIDTGGQYLHGTTKSTRMVHFGTPTDL